MVMCRGGGILDLSFVIRHVMAKRIDAQPAMKLEWGITNDESIPNDAKIIAPTHRVDLKCC
jgi:hypothetical protein